MSLISGWGINRTSKDQLVDMLLNIQNGKNYRKIVIEERINDFIKQLKTEIKEDLNRTRPKVYDK